MAVSTCDQGYDVRTSILEHHDLAQRSTYGKAFLQVIDLWEHDAAVRRFVFARRFAGIAARLMGVPAVRLYQDQALF